LSVEATTCGPPQLIETRAVMHATSGTPLHAEHVAAQRAGKSVKLAASHPLAKQAFSKPSKRRAA
jgi:hypothetical protein